MRASTVVGRVGGLAVALGVGAAVLGGAGIGLADTDTDAGPGPSARTSHSADSTASTASAATDSPAGRAPRGGAEPGADVTGPADPADEPSAGAQRRARSAPSRGAGPETRGLDVLERAAAGGGVGSSPGDGRSNGPGTPSVPEAVLPEPPASVDPVTSQPAPVVAPPASSQTRAPVPVAALTAVPEIAASAPEPAPAPDPLPAPASAPVSSFLAAALAALSDPFAGDGTNVPADTPLDWAALAFARRQPAAAASLAAPVAAPAATLPIIMGPSGVPIPSVAYGEVVMSYFIPDGIPGTQQLLFTPEGLYPITGVKSLPLNVSAEQGVIILADALAKVPAGTPTTVFGYSQSAIMSSLLMAEDGYTINNVTYKVPEDLPVSFVLVGNEMNPNGGFLSRFSGRDMPLFSMPSLGIDFYGATPSGNVPVTNYAREYDGFADFPRYPLNFLSVANAGLGIVYVHTEYAPIPGGNCKVFCLTQAEVDNAIPLPSTSPTQQYFFIPTANLPLLQPLRVLPFIGDLLADLIQPALKVVVDLGYADPAHGFSSATQPNANELVPFGVFPQVDPAEVLTMFFDGVRQGIENFIRHLGPDGSVARQVAASLAAPSPLGALGSGDFIRTVQTLITDVSDYIATATSSLYSGLLPTADIITAIIATLPAYNFNLFLYGLQQMFAGEVLEGLVNAFGLPVAANVGLVTTAGLVGALVWAQSIAPLFGLDVPGAKPSD